MSRAIIISDRDFEASISVIYNDTGSVVELPGTYALKLYDQDRTLMVDATLANTKLASVTEATGVVVPAILAADLASVPDNFGSMELVRTDTGADVIFSIPVRFLPAGSAMPADGADGFIARSGNLIVTVANTETAAAMTLASNTIIADATLSGLSLLCARHLIMN